MNECNCGAKQAGGDECSHAFDCPVSLAMDRCTCGGEDDPNWIHTTDCPAHPRLVGLTPEMWGASTCRYCGKTACNCQEQRNAIARAHLERVTTKLNPMRDPVTGGEDSSGFFDRAGDYFRKGVDPRNHFGRHFYPDDYASDYSGYGDPLLQQKGMGLAAKIRSKVARWCNK